mmetsp:Transcript_21/g.36  ORF Transcript_21/g.36 Transcript_21/m.36 type:complete len:95 (-) Transcript_21:168-452(-)
MGKSKSSYVPAPKEPDLATPPNNFLVDAEEDLASSSPASGINPFGVFFCAALFQYVFSTLYSASFGFGAPLGFKVGDATASGAREESDAEEECV